MTRSLRQPNRPGNRRFEKHFGKRFLELLMDLLGQCYPWVEHSYDDPFYHKLGIYRCPNPLYGTDEISQTFKSVVLL